MPRHLITESGGQVTIHGVGYSALYPELERRQASPPSSIDGSSEWATWIGLVAFLCACASAVQTGTKSYNADVFNKTVWCGFGLALGLSGVTRSGSHTRSSCCCKQMNDNADS